jgi:hypothetical protein
MSPKQIDFEGRGNPAPSGHNAARAEGRPISRAGAAFIVTVWLLAAGALIWWLWPHVAL